MSKSIETLQVEKRPEDSQKAHPARQNLTKKEIIEFILIFGVGFIVTHLILSVFSTIKPFDRFLFRLVFFILFVLCIYSLKKVSDLEKIVGGIEKNIEKKEDSH